MARKLASIQMVSGLRPIENADRIEVAYIKGWEIVVQKGNFSIGDLCVFFEIDSVLPHEPVFGFMSDRKYRVRTIKLRGAVSQGLAIPLKDFDLGEVSKGDDVTEALGVTQYDPDAGKGKSYTHPGNYSSRKGSKIPWYKTFPVVSRIYKLFYPYDSRSFPPFVRKTDETRVENIHDISQYTEGCNLVWTEKMDGSSATFFYNRHARHGFRRGLFGVCSRNIWYHHRKNNYWWEAEKKYDIQKRLTEYCNEKKVSLAIQGELLGPGIQGNKYKLEARVLRLFSVYDIDDQKYLPEWGMLQVAGSLDLRTVPMLSKEHGLTTAKDYAEAADGTSAINHGVMREGVVVRDSIKQEISFKAVSKLFLLKHGA